MGQFIFISSPEPLGSQGELIVYPSSSVVPIVASYRKLVAVARNRRHV